MQKRDKNGSILIWSIFLSLIITLSFVFVSTKVNQSIRLNSFLEWFFNKDSTITNLVKTSWAWELWDNEFLVNDLDQYIIKNAENLVFSFSGVVGFSWTLKLKNWGPIYYEVISYSWANNLEYSLVNSWIISKVNSWVTFNWYLGNDYNNANLTIKNLWGLSTFIISSSQDYYWIWKKYKVLKNIWWKNIEKSSFEN